MLDNADGRFDDYEGPLPGSRAWYMEKQRRSVLIGMDYRDPEYPDDFEDEDDE